MKTITTHSSNSIEDTTSPSTCIIGRSLSRQSIYPGINLSSLEILPAAINIPQNFTTYLRKLPVYIAAKLSTEPPNEPFVQN